MSISVSVCLSVCLYVCAVWSAVMGVDLHWYLVQRHDTCYHW